VLGDSPRKLLACKESEDPEVFPGVMYVSVYIFLDAGQHWGGGFTS